MRILSSSSIVRILALATMLPLTNAAASTTSSPTVYDFLDGVSAVSFGNPYNGTGQAFGYMDYQFETKMEEDYHIPIASNSKLFTSVAIFQLYEQGLLDVDADIATMLDESDFKNFGIQNVTSYCPKVFGADPDDPCEVITLRDLLGMTSGIYPAGNCGPEKDTPTQCLQGTFLVVNPGSIEKNLESILLEPLMWPPGTQFGYSNPNYVLATYFVEKYSGKTFRQYLQDKIFDVANMTDTYFDYWDGGLGPLDPKRIRHYFKYYDNSTFDLMSVGLADKEEMNFGLASGTGGLISTALDVRKFWYMLFNRTTAGAPLLMKPETQEDILSPWILTGSEGIPGGATDESTERYFCMGIGIRCFQSGCPDGPDVIEYTGASSTTMTNNVMDYETYTMSQVWTASKAVATSPQALAEARAVQTGDIWDFLDAWTYPPWIASEINLQLFGEVTGAAEPTSASFWIMHSESEDDDDDERVTFSLEDSGAVSGQLVTAAALCSLAGTLLHGLFS